MANDVDYIAILLAFVYFFALCLGANQVYRIFNSRNNKFSLRSGIIGFLTLSSFIRVVFWIKVAVPTYVEEQIMTLLYFIPVWMQFSAFSLLCVFYIAAIADIRSQRPMRFCVIVNFIFFVICITLALLLNDPASSEETKDAAEIIYFIYGIFLDTILAGVLGYFGYNFGMKQKSNTVATRILPRSPMMFSYVNWMLVGVYIIRGITNLLAAMGQLKYFGSVEYNGDHPPSKYGLLLYFFVVEIVPMVCTLIVLWKRASRRKKVRNATLKTTLLPDIESSRSRSGATSVDDQKVSVKFATEPILNSGAAKSDGVSDFAKTSGPPDWWTSMFSSRAQQANYNAAQLDAALSTSAGEMFPPAMDEIASEDDYMMFRDNPQTRSEGGVQFSPSTDKLRIVSKFDGAAPPVSNITLPAGSSGFSQNGSPLAAGTPPSFDAWIKSQTTSSQTASSSPLVTTPSLVQPSARGPLTQIPPQPPFGAIPPRGPVSGISMTLNYVPPSIPGMAASPGSTPSSMSTNMPMPSYLGAPPSLIGSGAPRSRMSATSSSVTSGSTDRFGDPNRSYMMPYGPGMPTDPAFSGPAGARLDGAPSNPNSLYLSQPPDLYENEDTPRESSEFMSPRDLLMRQSGTRN